MPFRVFQPITPACSYFAPWAPSLDTGTEKLYLSFHPGIVASGLVTFASFSPWMNRTEMYEYAVLRFKLRHDFQRCCITLWRSLSDSILHIVSILYIVYKFSFWSLVLLLTGFLLAKLGISCYTLVFVIVENQIVSFVGVLQLKFAFVNLLSVDLGSLFALGTGEKWLVDIQFRFQISLTTMTSVVTPECLICHTGVAIGLQFVILPDVSI